MCVSIQVCVCENGLQGYSNSEHKYKSAPRRLYGPEHQKPSIKVSRCLTEFGHVLRDSVHLDLMQMSSMSRVPLRFIFRLICWDNAFSDSENAPAKLSNDGVSRNNLARFEQGFSISTSCMDKLGALVD